MTSPPLLLRLLILLCLAQYISKAALAQAQDNVTAFLLASCPSTLASTLSCTSSEPVSRTITRGWYKCWTEVPGANPAIRVLIPEVYSKWLLPTLGRFSEQYGIPLEYNIQPSQQLLPSILGDADLPVAQQHAVWLQTTITTQHLAETGRSADMSHLASLSAELSWPDVLQIFRLQLASYRGSMYAMPLDGSTMYMLARRPVFGRLDVPVPITWQSIVEFIEGYQQLTAVARARGAGDDELPPYPICLPRGASCQQLSLLQAIWSSIAQTNGSQQGVHFDTASGTPLLDTPAGREAFRIMARLLAGSAPHEPDETCMRGSLAFARGRCALVVAAFIPQMRTLIVPEYNGTVPDGTTLTFTTPASELVWARGPDPVGGELKPCTRELCPYASLRTIRNTTKLVNYAPLVPGSNLAGSVNAAHSYVVQMIGYTILEYLALPERFNSDEQPPLLQYFAPVRQKFVAADVVDRYVAAGYNRTAMLECMPTLKFTREHPNRAWDLRMPYHMQYYDVLNDLVSGLRNGSVVADVAAPAAAPATGANGSAAAGRRMARRGLLLAPVQLDKAAVAPSSPPPPSIPATAVSLSAALRKGQAVLAAYYTPQVFLPKYLHSLDISDTSTPVAAEPPAARKGLGAAAVAGLSVSCSALCACAAIPLFIWARRQHQHRCRRRTSREWIQRLLDSSQNTAPAEPAALVVTDIQDSTGLWEALPPSIMAEAIQLHHATVRRLLRAHGGYESSTEGDSFILAFPSVKQAAAFALDLQAQLLLQPWPEELLQQPTCSAVCADLPEGFPFAGSRQQRLRVEKTASHSHRSLWSTNSTATDGREDSIGSRQDFLATAAAVATAATSGRNGGSGRASRTASLQATPSGLASLRTRRSRDFATAPGAPSFADGSQLLSRLAPLFQRLGTSHKVPEGQRSMRSQSLRCMQPQAQLADSHRGVRGATDFGATADAYHSSTGADNTTGEDEESSDAVAATAAFSSRRNPALRPSLSIARSGNLTQPGPKSPLGSNAPCGDEALVREGGGPRTDGGHRGLVERASPHPPQLLSAISSVHSDSSVTQEITVAHIAVDGAGSGGGNVAHAGTRGDEAVLGTQLETQPSCESTDVPEPRPLPAPRGPSLVTARAASMQSRLRVMAQPRFGCGVGIGAAVEMRFSIDGPGSSAQHHHTQHFHPHRIHDSGPHHPPHLVSSHHHLHTQQQHHHMNNMHANHQHQQHPSMDIMFATTPLPQSQGDHEFRCSHRVLSREDAAEPVAPRPRWQILASMRNRVSRAGTFVSLVDRTRSPASAGKHGAASAASGRCTATQHAPRSSSSGLRLTLSQMLSTAAASATAPVSQQQPQQPGAGGAAAWAGWGGASKGPPVLFRGLRVRVGISWVSPSPSELQYNAAAARMVYGGPCVAGAKAVADMAAGGQVVLSGPALAQLEEECGPGPGGRPTGTMVLHLGTYALPRVASGGQRDATALMPAVFCRGQSCAAHRPSASGSAATTITGAALAATADAATSALATIASEATAHSHCGASVGRSQTPTPTTQTHSSNVSGALHQSTALSQAAAAQQQQPLPPEQRAIYWLTSPALSPRLALMPPLRVPSGLTPLYEVFNAPVGRLSYVAVQVPAAPVLLAWNAGVAEEALHLFNQAAAATLQRLGSRGPSIIVPTGVERWKACAAFANAGTAVWWALSLRAELLSAPWPQELMSHELCEVVEAAPGLFSDAPQPPSKRLFPKRLTNWLLPHEGEEPATHGSAGSHGSASGAQSARPHARASETGVAGLELNVMASRAPSVGQLALFLMQRQEGRPSRMSGRSGLAADVARQRDAQGGCVAEGAEAAAGAAGRAEQGSRLHHAAGSLRPTLSGGVVVPRRPAMPRALARPGAGMSGQSLAVAQSLPASPTSATAAAALEAVQVTQLRLTAGPLAATDRWRPHGEGGRCAAKGPETLSCPVTDAMHKRRAPVVFEPASGPLPTVKSATVQGQAAGPGVHEARPDSPHVASLHEQERCRSTSNVRLSLQLSSAPGARQASGPLSSGPVPQPASGSAFHLTSGHGSRPYPAELCCGEGAEEERLPRATSDISDAEALRPVVLLRGLRMRSGISSGVADWFLHEPTHSLAYTGRPVRTAVKLAAAAASGQVLCDEATRQEALAEQMWLAAMEEHALPHQGGNSAPSGGAATHQQQQPQEPAGAPAPARPPHFAFMPAVIGARLTDKRRILARAFVCGIHERANTRTTPPGPNEEPASKPLTAEVPRPSSSRPASSRTSFRIRHSLTIETSAVSVMSMANGV